MIERNGIEWLELLRSKDSEATNNLRTALVRGLTNGLRGKADTNLIKDSAQEASQRFNRAFNRTKN